MRHLAAYLLAAISENEVPTETKISNILGSVGVEADEKQIKTLIEKFGGKPPAKVIAEGMHLLSSMPSAGGMPAAAAVAAPGGKAAAGAPAAAKEEKKKEEKKEEPEEESDDDMGFGLFD